MREPLRLLLCVLAVLSLAPGLAFAQSTGTIQGQVLDTEDLPLPGVSIVLQGTLVGTATDVNGEFTLEAPVGDYTLVATYIGFLRHEEPVSVVAGETQTVNIQLQEDLIGLEEVVVTGYGIVEKRESTGAISSITARELENLPVQSFDQAIQGRASGVQVTSSSGAPGGALSINIRGTGSINAGNEPLYIVDGVQINSENSSRLASQNPLASINPNDIESVEVLKDVAAASIYGAQASNGVVLITTKGGQGRTRVNFTAQAGTRDRIKKIDVLDAQGLAEFRLEALSNYVTTELGWTADQAREYFIANYDYDAALAGEIESTDWQDAVYQTGTTQQYELSVSGGDTRTRFFLSGSYTGTQGQVIESNFTRGQLRANLDHNISPRVQVGTRINLSTIDQRGTVSDGAYINSPFFAAMFTRPDHPVYTEDGEYNRLSGTFSYNLVQLERLNDRFSNMNSLLGNVNLSWEITPGLTARSLVGLNFIDTQEDTYNDPRIPQFAATGGSGTARGERETNYNLSQTLNYLNTFSDVHNVNGLAGVEYKRETEEYFLASAQQFPNELFRTLQSAADPVTTTGYFTEWRLLSFFANGQYSYDDKYLFSGTLRYDGSSRFGEDRRFGLFGSASVGWRLSSESFLEDVDWMDDLKLRLSYGVTGNSDIADFAARRLFGTGGEYLGRPGIRASSLGNNLLTWEEAWETNAGVDYSFFRGRVAGAVDAYIRRNKALLLDRPLPGDVGFTQLTENVGTVENRGLEFEIETVNIDTRDFTWSTDFNISFVRNEVVELVGDQDITEEGLFIGEPIGTQYVVEYAGVNPADGRPMFYDADGNITYNITDNDRKIVGSNQPSFYGGLGTRLSYKGLSLDVFFQYDYGREVLNNDNYFLTQSGSAGWNQLERSYADRWQQPGDITDQPRAYWLGAENGASSMADFTSYHVEDASYIRLKNVRLDYQLPERLTQGIGIYSSSIFLQAQNLVTWTNYSGLDPEVAGEVGLGQYPQAKTLTAGIRVGL